MKIGVIGINHKLANLNLRELLAKACQRRFVAGNSLHGEHSYLLLSTCNRTEVYFSSEDLAVTHSYLLQVLRNEVDDDFDQKVYAFFGHDCFLHLARVTAGLDSAIVAETEIQGQVKAAYEHAARHLSLPEELHFLFQKALKIGKQVRTTLPMRRGMPDLEHAIFNAGKEVFIEPQNKKILFVGASDINQKILAFLKNKKFQDITVCNRSLNRAQTIAASYQVPVLQWEKLEEWHQFDWIIFGTKAPDYLITKEDLAGKNISPKLILDLCVPRNVDPDLCQDERITLLNIDQLNGNLSVRRQGLSNMLSQAEKVIADAARRNLECFQRREEYRSLLSVSF